MVSRRVSGDGVCEWGSAMLGPAVSQTVPAGRWGAAALTLARWGREYGARRTAAVGVTLRTGEVRGGRGGEEEGGEPREGARLLATLADHEAGREADDRGGRDEGGDGEEDHAASEGAAW